MKQTGLINAYPKLTDYIAGQETLIRGGYKNISGDWTGMMNIPEAQSNYLFDTMSCTTFSALNVLEALFKLLPEETKTRLRQLGFNQNLEISKRFTAIISGTTKQGNTYSNVADAIRKYGVIPEGEFPFGGNNWEEYHNASLITQAMKDKGQKVLQLLEFKYDWIMVDYNPLLSLDEKIKLEEGLKYSPLQIAIQTPATHSLALIDLAETSGKPHYKMFDQYSPFYFEGTEYYPNYAMRWAVDVLNTTPVVLTYPNFYFTKFLVLGSKGFEVKMLQQILIKEGFLKVGLDTGGFFQQTLLAVKNFQLKYGIQTTGNVGPITRAKLNELCKSTPTSGIEVDEKFIRGEEGCRLSAYQDVGGVWTIGWGNTYWFDDSPVNRYMKITQAEADDLYRYVLSRYIKMVRDKITIPLNKNQLTALTSICYNSGTLSNVFADKINRGVVTEEDFASYRATVNGKPLVALRNRRLREYKKFKTL
jgi:lysozyme